MSESLLPTPSFWLCFIGDLSHFGVFPVFFWRGSGSKRIQASQSMAIKDVQTYIDRRGLVETEDSEVDKPIWRKPGFNGVRSLLEMEEDLSRFLRERRDALNLNREQVGMMVGLHPEIYARHERAGAKLRATRLFQLAELLDFSPIEAIYAAAPQFFGDSEQEAQVKLKLMMRMLDLPSSTAQHLLMMIEELSPDSASEDTLAQGDTKRRV